MTKRVRRGYVLRTAVAISFCACGDRPIEFQSTGDDRLTAEPAMSTGDLIDDAARVATFDDDQDLVDDDSEGLVPAGPKMCPQGTIERPEPGNPMPVKFDIACPATLKVDREASTGPKVDGECVGEGDFASFYWCRYDCRFRPEALIRSTDPRFLEWLANPRRADRLPFCKQDQANANRFDFYLKGCDDAVLPGIKMDPIKPVLGFWQQHLGGNRQFRVAPNGPYPTSEAARAACENERKNAPKCPPSGEACDGFLAKAVKEDSEEAMTFLQFQNLGTCCLPP